MNETEARPTAYSYVRMSSQQQIKGDSLRRQLDLSRKYAADHNLILDEGLSDIGVSAWTGANVKDGALGRFLQLINSGRIVRGSFLLVESLDRLSRQQVRNAIGPFIDIINAGVAIVTLTDGQVYSEATVDENWTQLMMSLAIMSRAHEESQTKSKRLKEAHANRKRLAAQGIGRFSPNMWGWIDQSEVAPNKYEYRLNNHASTILRIYEMADAGLGQMVITRRLNDENVPTFRATKKGWQQPNVGAILRNEAVIGTYQPTQSIDGKRTPSGQPLKGYLPQAVPEELFWRVQRNKQKPLSSGRKGNQLSNLFTSHCICSGCNGPVRLRDASSAKQSRKYLHCDNNYRSVGCPSKGGAFRYEVFEQAILDHVKEFDLDLIDGKPVQQKDALVADIGLKETELMNVEKRKSALLRALELTDDDSHIRDVLGQLSERRIEAEQLTSQITSLKGQLGTLDARERELASSGERIQIERLKWTTGSDVEVYESRARVQQMLSAYIDIILFDFDQKRARVSIAGHLVLYEFDLKGNLVQKIDNRKLITNRQRQVHWKHKDENGHAMETGDIITPAGWTLDTALTSIPLSDETRYLREQRKTIVQSLMTKRPRQK